MAGTDLDDEAEKPLDPATERLRRKMVRLLAVSITTMLVAVMAVLATVVYKVSRGDGPAQAPNQTVAIDLPAGTAIEEMTMEGGEALLRVRDGETERLLRIDLSSGRVVARYEIRRP